MSGEELEHGWTHDLRPRVLDHAATIEQMLEMRRNIPRSEMLILNHADLGVGGNHTVQHTRPEIVGPAMLEFLARHSDGPTGEQSA